MNKTRENKVGNMPKVYKVPTSLYEKYHGTGYGLVAVLSGEIVDLKYFEDISDYEFVEL